MRLAKRQAGMSMIGWMLTIALGGVVAIFVIKLVPVYIENMTIGSILKGMSSDQGADFSTTEKVRTSIERRFDMNNIKTVQMKDVIIENMGGSYAITLDYEVRVPFMGNIDLVTTFSEKAQVGVR